MGGAPFQWDSYYRYLVAPGPFPWQIVDFGGLTTERSLTKIPRFIGPRD